jgi:hypothetical protein
MLCACSSQTINRNFRESGTSLEIHDLQGCAHESPYNGKNVSDIQGIVTWKTNNGFFMQSQNQDNEFCTSEGIFVFTNHFASVLPGDLVTVAGKVEEFFPGNKEDHNLSVTEIVADQYKINSSGNLIPEPFHIPQDLLDAIPVKVIEDDGFTKYDPVSDGLDFWESLEGMLVKIDKAVVVGPQNAFDEVVVVPESLLGRNVVSIEGALIHTEEDINPEKIIIELPSNFNEK